ncbi:hypothetical protein ACQ86N_05280 [Puia sp. P3]|uniref:hypothetical protein n=1 Tax=Puia sp. P3 TaxID=3423952 RepID=UPI003D67DBBC
MNVYLREELHYRTDLNYYLFGPVRPWNNQNDHTGENLRKAIAENPFLHLMIQSGYYDGACDYFNAKYSLWQLDPSGKLKDRLSWEGYRSGHMMYLRKPDLEAATESLRKFIKASLPKPGNRLSTRNGESVNRRLIFHKNLFSAGPIGPAVFLSV